VEFGVGPNFSYNRDSGDTIGSMVVAAGATMPFGDIYVPGNVAAARPGRPPGRHPPGVDHRLTAPRQGASGGGGSSPPEALSGTSVSYVECRIG